MKGLLYKEFMLELPTILVYSAVQVILTVIMVIMAFLSIGDQESIMLNMVMAVADSFVIYFFLSMIPITAFFPDATHVWQSFAAACPLGGAGQVGSKYLILLFCYIGAFIVHTLQYIAVSLITGEDYYFLIIVDLLLFSGGIIISSVEYPFFFAFGAEKGQSVKAASIASVIFLLAAYLLFGDVSFFNAPSPLAVLLSYVMNSSVIFVFIGIMLIAMPVFCLSMTISIKLFPKGLESLEQ